MKESVWAVWQKRRLERWENNSGTRGIKQRVSDLVWVLYLYT